MQRRHSNVVAALACLLWHTGQTEAAGEAAEHGGTECLARGAECVFLKKQIETAVLSRTSSMMLSDLSVASNGLAILAVTIPSFFTRPMGVFVK